MTTCLRSTLMRLLLPLAALEDARVGLLQRERDEAAEHGQHARDQQRRLEAVPVGQRAADQRADEPARQLADGHDQAHRGRRLRLAERFRRDQAHEQREHARCRSSSRT
jgi:hypothetical protein